MAPQKNNYRFFQNVDCEYFPCHNVEDRDTFSCLFCYCPLYFLGERCGGNYKRIGLYGEVKDCSNCLIPHEAVNYDRIINIIGKNLEQLTPMDDVNYEK